MNRILFVCMGNICRSPSAEGFFRKLVQQAGIEHRFQLDSAGTHGYHIGYPPDSRAIEMASKFGVDISELRARKIQATDFADFDLIVGMDELNRSTIERLRPADGGARIAGMMDWAPGAGYSEVPDPYYGTREDFRLMCELLDVATRGLFEDIQA